MYTSQIKGNQLVYMYKESTARVKNGDKLEPLNYCNRCKRNASLNRLKDGLESRDTLIVHM